MTENTLERGFMIGYGFGALTAMNELLKTNMKAEDIDFIMRKFCNVLDIDYVNNEEAMQLEELLKNTKTKFMEMLNRDTGGISR